MASMYMFSSICLGLLLATQDVLVRYHVGSTACRNMCKWPVGWRITSIDI